MKQRLNIKAGEVVAIDFETLYDSKTKYSLKNMTPSDYVRHPRFDPYLVAFTADSGDKYVGPPCDFDWSCLEGSHLIAHNATFDGMVLLRMFELKMVPQFNYLMDCTADMCACLGLGRSLKHAALNVLGITLSKKVRTDMDGKVLNDLTHDEAAALYEYGGSDSDVCLELWRAKSAEWPELEREISRENRKANWGGIRIDRKAAVEGLAMLKAKAESALKLMPWVASGEKPNSTAALADCAKRHGIPTLKSYNKTDPAMQAWIARYAADYPFIQARLDYASTVPHIARVESILEMMGDGVNDVVLFDSCYFGAHTGRCSGSPSGDDAGGARMNFFNIPKGDEDGLVHGVDLRGMLIPRPGKKFAIYDYSNIEPRVVQWIAGGTEFLSLVAKENIYQATAKSMGWFPKDGDGLKYKDKKLYALSKSTTIGTGFRMGAGKFLLTCRKQRTTIDPIPPEQWNLDRRMKFILSNVEEVDWRDPANVGHISAFVAADRVVQEWRAKNPKVVALWLALENQMKTAAKNGQTEYTFRLPSGRAKTYYNLAMRTVPKIVIDPDDPKKREQRFDTQLFASTMKGSKPIPIHGGVLTEHLVQSIARDIMFQGARDIWKAYPHWTYIGNVYDEVIFEIPEEDAELADRVVPELLCNGTARAWMGDLPLAVEGGIRDKYEK